MMVINLPIYSNQISLANRIKFLLKKVQKGKSRNQDDTLNEFKTRGQETVGRAISWVKRL